MTDIPEPVICGRQRFNTTHNQILGLEQEVPYRCPRVASVTLPDGAPACTECAELATDQIDSGKLSRLAHEVAAVAAEMPYRAELYDWLITFSTEIDRAANALAQS